MYVTKNKNIKRMN